MVKWKYFFFLFSVCVLNAQQLPIDFSSTQDVFSGFSGTSFTRRADPTLASNMVGQFNNDGAVAAQGAFIDLVTPVDLDNDPIVDFRFYSFDPNSHQVLVKLENGANPNVELSVTVPSGSNIWRDVSVDFSTIAAVGTYSRITLFIDINTPGAGTYLIDDITNGASGPNVDVVYTDLVWSDEFNTNGAATAVDPTKWHHQTQLPAGGNWFNGEAQHYTNRLDNSYVENGFLHIVAKREVFTDQGETKQYTSARLNSKFAFTYGRVDVRAKLPFGEGTWPAIWTLGKNINEDGAYWDATHGTTNWPLCGEIDIMEHGLGPVNQVSAALHTNCAGCWGSTMNYMPFMLNDVANTFHVYSVNWSPQQITFLIDDNPFYTYNPAVKNIDTWPFDADQYLLLNIAMGGVSGAIDPNFTQGEMLIDYVRVYQNTLTIPSVDASLEVQVYPNPATDYINVVSEFNVTSLSLYNMLGQQLLTTTGNKRLSVAQMPNGAYILKVQHEAGVISKKVVIQH